MKNIEDILAEIGVEIPEDKKEDFKKVFNENYKTVAELESVKKNLDTANEQLKKRDEDLEALKEKAKGDDENSKKLKEEIEALQKSSKEEKEALEKQIESQKYDFEIEKRCASLNFSSKAGKKAFIADLKEKGLKLEDGKLLGFDDFVESYKKEDAGVFADEETEKPQFGGRTSRVGKKMTKEEIMKIENRAERQQAIAENIDLFS